MAVVVDEFKEISAQLRPEKMIGRTIDAIVKLLPVERASVFIVDREAGVLRTFNEMELQRTESLRAEDSQESSDAGEESVVRTITIPIDKGIAGAVVQSGDKLIIPDARKEQWQRDHPHKDISEYAGSGNIRTEKSKDWYATMSSGMHRYR